MIDEHLLRLAAGEHDRLAISAPPRHGKSLLATILFPLWFLAQQPEASVIVATCSQELADYFGRKSRDLAERYFPDLFGLQVRSDSHSASRWEFTTGGSYFATGVGGSIIGRGGDLIILDDPFGSSEAAESAAERERVARWFAGSLRTRLEPGGRLAIIMSRWHRQDLIGKLLDSGEPWEYLCLPAIAGTNDPLGRTRGEALWPERFSAGALMGRKQTSGERIFAAQYQQAPLADASAEFPASWFDDCWTDTMPSRFEYSALALDAATGRGRDYSAVVFLGVADGIGYCDARMLKAPINTTVEAYLDVWGLYQPTRSAVESNGFQELIGGMLEQRYRERYGSFALLDLELLDNRVPKAIRIRRLSPYLSSGLIKFFDTPHTREVVGQLMDFPNGANDDGPDALEMAARVIENMVSQSSFDDPFDGFDVIPDSPVPRLGDYG